MDAKLAILVAVLVGSAPPATVPIEVKGKVAGKTQRCLPGPTNVIFEVSASDPQSLVFDDGKRVWVTQMKNECQFEAGQSVIPETLAPYYCNGDMVRVGGAMTVLPLPGRYCALGNFTAYSTPK